MQRQQRRCACSARAADATLAEFRRAVAAGEPVSLAQAAQVLPYRSLLGNGSADDPRDMWARIESAIVVLGADPEPLDEGIINDAVAAIHNGGVVLLMSDHPESRDYAKREILAMAGAPAGRA
jgi:hypothetical protein